MCLFEMASGLVEEPGLNAAAAAEEDVTRGSGSAPAAPPVEVAPRPSRGTASKYHDFVKVTFTDRLSD